MHRNDNEFDQYFRDRLRDHSSPVRGDLWRRIHPGIDTPVRSFHLLRHWRFIGAGAAAAAAVVTVVFMINHYSKIPGTRRSITAIHPTTRPAATRSTTGRSDTVTQSVSANIAVANKSVHVNRRANSTTHRVNIFENTAATRPTTRAAARLADHPTAAKPAERDYLVTLPAIALISRRPVINIRPSFPRTRHKDPDVDPADNRFIKTGYVSLYGSPDFPANHYYTWSYTIGGTVTIQFGRHWSGTAGFEYGKVNVPTQVVPPARLADTLRAFYWSNYQVPVLIGYTMMLGNYALTVNGGAILNLYFHRSTGDWVNNWPDRDSYGAYLGADIFRPVGHSIRVFAQPYARYSISNYRMFIPEQRFFYGAHLGVRYQL